MKLILILTWFILISSCCHGAGGKSLSDSFLSANHDSLYWFYCGKKSQELIPGCTETKFFSPSCKKDNCKPPYNSKDWQYRFMDLTNERDLVIIENMTLIPREQLVR